MKIIRARNVNDAYLKGLILIREDGLRQGSRAGEVLALPYPVTTIYENPQERVLFCPNRDANPFFHLFEALWMLSGSNDATWLDQFVKDFSSRFAEDDGLQHGAYGFRWRKHFDVEGGGRFGLPDQLNTLVQMLRRDQFDRRAVLTMWDPVADLGADRRDIPCNLVVVPRIRLEEAEPEPFGGDPLVRPVLDITVFCRSNDAIFGCYGANAVHFSVLQEYLAARLGVNVGRYYQVSNNFHAYTAVLDKVWPPSGLDYYVTGTVSPTHMFTNPDDIDPDVSRFMDWTVSSEPDQQPQIYPHNTWFHETAEPMFVSHMLWKQKDHNHALEVLTNSSFLMADDWQIAAKAWMERRIKK